MSDINSVIERLNAPCCEERLNAARELMALCDAGEDIFPPVGKDVNNHIHTTYSFSPYSPTKAVYMAKKAGLETAGIMDHDSIAGAEEFIKAGAIFRMAITVGMECRVSFAGTAMEGRLTNNPDQPTITYMALHGVPHSQLGKVQEFFAKTRKLRNDRDAGEVERINALLAPAGIVLDFEKDVMPISLTAKGGSITERHILFALAGKIIERCGRGEKVLELLASLGITPGAKVTGFLKDESNPYYDYDLLGVLKSEFVPKIFIPADEECFNVREVIALAEEVGAVSAYPYLGDVGDSVTGDKKAQKFEDDYLDELAEELHKLGFNAITYMPSRNTKAQLQRLRAICDRYGFFQISGEDINQPRQSFICTAMRDPEFSNLYDAAWALIGHELAATDNLKDSMFSGENKGRDLYERIACYRDAALRHYGKL